MASNGQEKELSRFQPWKVADSNDPLANLQNPTPLRVGAESQESLVKVSPKRDTTAIGSMFIKVNCIILLFLYAKIVQGTRTCDTIEVPIILLVVFSVNTSTSTIVSMFACSTYIVDMRLHHNFAK